MHMSVFATLRAHECVYVFARELDEVEKQNRSNMNEITKAKSKT